MSQDHSPAPWRFSREHYGVANAIVDAVGRILFDHALDRVGSLVAVAPTMYAVLKRIAIGCRKVMYSEIWRGVQSRGQPMSEGRP